MAKRRTKKQKVKSEQKKQAETHGFRVEFTELKNDKMRDSRQQSDINTHKYFRTDLTKVFILTMLALALEFALYFILKR